MSSFGCLTRLCLHRHTWLDDHPPARDRHPRCRSTVPNGQEACYVLPSSKRHGAHHHRHRGPCRDRRADRPASSSPNVSITKGLEGRLGIPPLRESSPVGPPTVAGGDSLSLTPRPGSGRGQAEDDLSGWRAVISDVAVIAANASRLGKIGSRRQSSPRAEAATRRSDGLGVVPRDVVEA